MQSTLVLQNIPEVAARMDAMTKFWSKASHDNLATFSVSPYYTQMYLAEYHALAQHATKKFNVALPSLNNNNNTTVPPSDILNYLDPSLLCGDDVNLHMPTTVTDMKVMQDILHRSCFVTGFHKIISHATTFEGVVENIRQLHTKYIEDRAAGIKKNDIFDDLYEECGGESFSMQIVLQKASIKPADQQALRAEILDILIPTAKVSLSAPKVKYTLHVTCCQLDPAIFTKELVEEKKALPYYFYFTKQLAVKDPETAINPNNYKIADRKYKGSTCCPEILAISMANMSQIDSTSQVLEGFTGTGSIQIACSLFTKNVIGQDLDIQQILGVYKKKQQGREEKIAAEHARIQAEKEKAAQIVAEGLCEKSAQGYLKKPKIKQLRGVCIQEDYNVFDNYNFYNLERPEFVNADNSNAPYRMTKIDKPYYNTQHITIPEFVMYKTIKGKPCNEEEEQKYNKMLHIERQYIDNVVLPTRLEMFNRYAQVYNKKIQQEEQEQKEQDIDINQQQEQQQQQSNNNIPSPLFDVYIGDPPFGVKIKSATLTSTDSKNKGATAYIHSLNQKRYDKKNNQKDANNNNDNDNTSNKENPDIERTNNVSESQQPVPENNNNNANKPSQQPYNKLRRELDREEMESGRWVTPVKATPPHEIIYQFFDNAAKILDNGGRLTFLLPTAKVLAGQINHLEPSLSPNHEIYLPSHPCFTLKYACPQNLPTWYSRWALVYEKTSNYDPTNPLHLNYVQNLRNTAGVPLWSLHTAAKARITANQKHDYPMQILFDAKEFLDNYGFEHDFDEGEDK